MVAAAAMKMAAALAKARTTVTAGNGVVTIALVALTITHFVTCHVVANAIAPFVANAIAFVSVQQRGGWQGPARAMVMVTR